MTINYKLHPSRINEKAHTQIVYRTHIQLPLIPKFWRVKAIWISHGFNNNSSYFKFCKYSYSLIYCISNWRLSPYDAITVPFKESRYAAKRINIAHYWYKKRRLFITKFFAQKQQFFLSTLLGGTSCIGKFWNTVETNNNVCIIPGLITSLSEQICYKHYDIYQR